LQVDIDRIRADNLLKKDVQRKSGLIIWAGRTLLASKPRLSLADFGLNCSQTRHFYYGLGAPALSGSVLLASLAWSMTLVQSQQLLYS